MCIDRFVGRISILLAVRCNNVVRYYAMCTNQRFGITCTNMEQISGLKYFKLQQKLANTLKTHEKSDGKEDHTAWMFVGRCGIGADYIISDK